MTKTEKKLDIICDFLMRNYYVYSNRKSPFTGLNTLEKINTNISLLCDV